jgi:hypothetical protein
MSAARSLANDSEKIVGDIKKKVKKRLVEPKGELLSRRVPNPES